MNWGENFLIMMAQTVKNLPATTGDPGPVPGSGRSLEKGMATHSSILSWRIPCTEEAPGYSPWGRKRIGHCWVHSSGLFSSQFRSSTKKIVSLLIDILFVSEFVHESAKKRFLKSNRGLTGWWTIISVVTFFVKITAESRKISWDFK